MCDIWSPVFQECIDVGTALPELEGRNRFVRPNCEASFWFHAVMLYNILYKSKTDFAKHRNHTWTFIHLFGSDCGFGVLCLHLYFCEL